VAVTAVPSALAGALRASALMPLPTAPSEPPTPAEVAARLAAGEVAPALRGAEPVAVIRTESGRLYVLPDRCPHDGGPISDGYVEGERIVCARHGWQLEACSGRRECPSALRA
jgi:nitrite reductase/ring-hydroxylating ferredoxin subunit